MAGCNKTSKVIWHSVSDYLAWIVAVGLALEVEVYVERAFGIKSSLVLERDYLTVSCTHTAEEDPKVTSMRSKKRAHTQQEANLQRAPRKNERLKTFHQ
eukprot:5175507-Amphidinium_carterae.1